MPERIQYNTARILPLPRAILNKILANRSLVTSSESPEAPQQSQQGKLNIARRNNIKRRARPPVSLNFLE